MQKKTLIIAGIIAAAILASILGFYGYYNGLNTERVEHETTLSAGYQSNQLELDTYVKTIKEAVGIANVKSDKIDQILHDAVIGRYGDSRQNLDGTTPPKNGQGGSFISAIVEAYPDIKGQLNVYDRIVDKVFAGREAFKQKQNLLLDRARAYDRWMNTGLVQSFIIKRMIGCPTDLLEARVGNSVKHGRDAFDQIKLVVTSSGTNEAFNTGNDEGVEIPGAKK
jgi:hypothetical protein